MKQTSRTTPRGKNFIKAILAILLLVFMSAELINSNNRIISTASTLARISVEIQDYNESYIKTDERTSEIKELYEERAELYNSEDWLIRIFSKSSIKIVFILLAVISDLAVIIIWINVIAEIVEKVSKKLKKKCKC